MNKVLIIVAHPDDEVLGAGGVIRKHANKGDEVYCLILGEGIVSRLETNPINNKIGENCIRELKEQAINASKILGLKEIFFSKFPDQRFDSVNFLDIVKEVEKYIEAVKPKIVYTHFGSDLNIDHQITFNAVITAARPCNINCPKQIYCFETLSSTEWQLEKEKFNPNVYVNIMEEIKFKIKAMEEYKSEIKEYPHSRSIEGIEILAQYRGLESGMEYAEAFYLVKEISD